MPSCYVLVDPDGSSGYWYRTIDVVNPDSKRVVVWSSEASRQRLGYFIPHAISPDFELIYDGNSIDAISARYNVLAILPGCDNSVWLVEELQRALTPALSNPDDTKHHRRNKLSVYDRLHNAGMIEQVQCVTSLDQKHISIACPSVIKPIDGRGSSEISFIDTQQQLAAYLSRPAAQRRQYIIQKRYVGSEYAIDMVSRKGKHFLTAVWRYDIPAHSHVVDEVTLVDPIRNQGLVAKLAGYVREVLKNLDYHNGPSHAEVIVSPDGNVSLVEVNFRLHGHLDEKAVEHSLHRSQILLSMDPFVSGPTWTEDNTFGFKRALKKVFINNIEPKYIEKIDWSGIREHLDPNLHTIYKHAHLYPGYLGPTTYLGDSLGVVVMVGRDMSKWAEHVGLVRRWKDALANAKTL